MQQGKDVYLEKPVSHNVSEGRRCIEAARKYNRICQTGTQCRSMPGMRKAMEYLHQGNLGEVKLARGLCYKHRKSIGLRGNDSGKLRVGDRVVVPFPIACGACAACHAELYSCCENTNPNAGLAEKMFGHPTAGIFGYSHLTGGFAGVRPSMPGSRSPTWAR